MKNNKYFIKPFESFYIDKDITIKEKWLLAFKDPAWLILLIINILGFIFLLNVLW